MSDSGTPDDDDIPDPFDLTNLFGGDPTAMMSQFMNLFGGISPSTGLDQAVQIAVSIAAGGQPEENVEPVDRMQLEQLARVAELRIEQATGLRVSTRGPLSISPITRTEWVRQSIESYRPILEALAESMASPIVDDDLAGDPQFAMFEQLFTALRPMMTTMTTGSMVGHLASRALGTYDLPIPRPRSNDILIVVPNLDAFGAEWSLDKADLRIWIALSEVTHHAVLSTPHVAERLTGLLHRYVAGFRNDPSAISDSLGELEFDPSADFAELQQQLQSMFGDPSAVLGAMRSPEQDALLPELGALTGLIVGYVDYIMDTVGHGLIATYSQLTEALRRRRVAASESDRFVERLLGLELDQALYDRGRRFIDGLVKRGGPDVLPGLWTDVASLPTVAEMDAPGLWLARMGIEFDLDVEAEVGYELGDRDFMEDDPEPTSDDEET